MSHFPSKIDPEEPLGSVIISISFSLDSPPPCYLVGHSCRAAAFIGHLLFARPSVKCKGSALVAFDSPARERLLSSSGWARALSRSQELGDGSWGKNRRNLADEGLQLKCEEVRSQDAIMSEVSRQRTQPQAGGEGGALEEPREGSTAPGEALVGSL